MFWEGKIFRFFSSHALIDSTGGRSSPSSVAIYTDLVERIERICKLIYTFSVKWSTASVMISPLLAASVNYFVFDMGDESFQFNGNLWFPFDKNSPIGFFVAAIFQFFAMFAVFYCGMPLSCVYFGSCWLIVAFLKDIARDFSHLTKKKIRNLNEHQLNKHFGDFVRFHADVEKLSRQCAFCNAIKCSSNLSF